MKIVSYLYVKYNKSPRRPCIKNPGELHSYPGQMKIEF